jgi:hypothetical protein
MGQAFLVGADEEMCDEVLDMHIYEYIFIIYLCIYIHICIYVYI